MRGFLTFIAFLLFFLAFPLAAVSYSVNSLLNPGYIKETLRENETYPTIAEFLPKMIRELQAGEKASQEEKQQFEKFKPALEEFVRKEITAPYLQKKTEAAVDSTFAWAVGKRKIYRR